MMLGALAALGCSFTWAYASARYAQAARDVGAQRVNLARAVTVLPLYAAWAFARHGLDAFDRVTPRAAAWLMLSMLCSYAIADNLFFSAARRMGISTALAIASIYPLWAALGGVLFAGEPLGTVRALGTLLCVGGVVALVRLSPGAAGERRRTDRAGLIMALLTSVLWAGNSIATQRGGLGLPVAQVNAVRYATALVLLFMQVKLFAPAPPKPSPSGGWLGLLPAILSDALLGSVLYVYGLTHTDLAIGATLSSLAPLISVPMAIALREEAWSPPRFLAVAVTVGGVVVLIAGG